MSGARIKFTVLVHWAVGGGVTQSMGRCLRLQAGNPLGCLGPLERVLRTASGSVEYSPAVRLRLFGAKNRQIGATLRQRATVVECGDKLWQ